MLLSIIVPTYNVEEYIANCIESLLDQDLSKDAYEILVINDGTTDRSAEIAGAYASNNENVILVNQKNKGLSGARNTGMALAKGKYTYFIDSDDYIAKNTLGSISTMLEEHQLDILGLGVIETGRLDIKQSNNIEILRSKNLKVSDGITFVAENKYMNNAWWYFIRTAFLKNSGLCFPEGRLVEDANFTSKLLVAAQRISYIPLDFYRYYLRPNSIMRKTEICHIKRLVGDYERNVYEFNAQLKVLRTLDHPKINECIERITARQQSFVFFLLVKCLRFGLPKTEINKMLSGFEKIKAYPITKFLGRDFNKIIYKIVVPIMNNKKLFFALLKLKSIAK